MSTSTTDEPTVCGGADLDAVGVCDGDGVADGVCDFDGVAVGDCVFDGVRDGVNVAVAEGDCDGVGVSAPDGDTEGVPESGAPADDVCVPVGGGVGVRDVVGVRDGDTLGVGLTDESTMPWIYTPAPYVTPGML